MAKDLFRQEAFVGFGSCALSMGEDRPLRHFRARRGRALRAAVRKHAPKLPGVYGMIDPGGRLIYVGKSKSLRSRLLSYFVPGNKDTKAGEIVRHARRLVWEVCADEFASLLRELELIRRFQPHYNVQGQPKRLRRCYVVVGRRPAPYAFVATKPPTRSLLCVGPVAGVGRAKEAARRLNDWYRLRDCPQKQEMIFADQSELFPIVRAAGCLRHEIGSCLGPCAAACSRDAYEFNVGAALDFLRGKDRTPLEEIERRMTEAAEAMEFERATILRERLAALTWLWKQLDRLRTGVTLSGVYPVTGHDGLERWYAIHHGLARAVMASPTDDEGSMRAGVRLREVYRNRATGTPSVDEIDGVLLVDGWFRRHKAERARLMAAEEAMRRVGEGYRAGA